MTRSISAFLFLILRMHAFAPDGLVFVCACVYVCVHVCVCVCVCVPSFDKHEYGGWANAFFSWGKPFGLGGANKNGKEGVRGQWALDCPKRMVRSKKWSKLCECDRGKEMTPRPYSSG